MTQVLPQCCLLVDIQIPAGIEETQFFRFAAFHLSGTPVTQIPQTIAVIQTNSTALIQPDLPHHHYAADAAPTLHETSAEPLPDASESSPRCGP